MSIVKRKSTESTSKKVSKRLRTTSATPVIKPPTGNEMHDIVHQLPQWLDNVMGTRLFFDGWVLCVSYLSERVRILMALRTLLARFRVKYGPRVEYEGVMCEYIMGYFRKHPTVDQWSVRLPLSTFCGALYRQSIPRVSAARRKAAEMISLSGNLSPMVFGAAYDLLKHHVAFEEVSAVCALAACRAVQDRNMPLLQAVPVTLSWMSDLLWALMFGSLSDLDAGVLNAMHKTTRALYIARRRPQLTVDHLPAICLLLHRTEEISIGFGAVKSRTIISTVASTDPRKAVELFCRNDCHGFWVYFRTDLWAFDEKMASDDANYTFYPNCGALWLDMVRHLPDPTLEIAIPKLWHVKGHNYNPHRWWLQGHDTVLPAAVIAIVQRLKENEPIVASE